MIVKLEPWLACLTDGQIATLKMVYSRYDFATPLANGVKSFGMWTFVREFKALRCCAS
jgi:hypothetical protein